ncbi:MAG: DNA helicase [Microbacterium sp.]
MSLSVSKKQKKQLKQLQRSATDLWQEQRRVAAEAADIARDAGAQLQTFGRHQVAPALEEKYHEHLEPYVDRARPYVDRGVKASKGLLDGVVIPTVSKAASRASKAWDATADQRAVLAERIGIAEPVVVAKKKSKAGPVLAVILGAAAAAAVLYVAWKALRADDELWVADDPLASDS